MSCSGQIKGGHWSEGSKREGLFPSCPAMSSLEISLLSALILDILKVKLPQTLILFYKRHLLSKNQYKLVKVKEK